MPQERRHQSDDYTTGGPLVEFVDEAHEVTEEERNRPRYGRPARKPADPPKADDTPPAREAT